MTEYSEEHKGGWRAYDVVFFIDARAVIYRVFARNRKHAIMRGFEVLVADAAKEVDVIRVEGHLGNIPF